MNANLRINSSSINAEVLFAGVIHFSLHAFIPVSNFFCPLNLQNAIGLSYLITCSIHDEVQFSVEPVTGRESRCEQKNEPHCCLKPPELLC